MARRKWVGGPPRDPRDFEDDRRYGEDYYDYADRELELMERLAEQGSVDIGCPEVRRLAAWLLRGAAPTVERLEMAHEPPPNSEDDQLDQAA